VLDPKKQIIAIHTLYVLMQLRISLDA